jgi:SPP1 gp7 family putative phage head morphogenesis protein
VENIHVKHNAKFPGDLESSYAEIFSDLIESINRDYQKELRIDKNLFKQTLKSMNNILDRLAGRIDRDIKKQLKKKKQPIPKIAFQADNQALKSGVKDNVDLITAITDAQANELEKAVIKSVKGGSSPETIIKEVEKISDNGRNYAEFVARDQLGKIHGQMNEDMQTRAGFPGYIWRITNDTRVREDHRAQKGKFFLWGHPPLLENGNLNPGEDFQCRCLAEPAFGPE